MKSIWGGPGRNIFQDNPDVRRFHHPPVGGQVPHSSLIIAVTLAPTQRTNSLILLQKPPECGILDVAVGEPRLWHLER
jgi:hypothetical protein